MTRSSAERVAFCEALCGVSQLRSSTLRKFKDGALQSEVEAALAGATQLMELKFFAPMYPWMQLLSSVRSFVPPIMWHHFLMACKAQAAVCTYLHVVFVAMCVLDCIVAPGLMAALQRIWFYGILP